jgi:hypothetical protein
MMSDKIYMITLDSTDPAVETRGLKGFLKSSSDIKNWWNHIPFVYLVVTNLEADAISDRVRPFTGNARFLVMEVDLAESEGALPEKAWRWIRARSGQGELSSAS